MKILKATLVTLLATSLAATGAVARPTKTSRSKSSQTAVKKSKSSSRSKSRGKNAKRSGGTSSSSAGERFKGSFDLPAEELPVPEEEPLSR